MTNIIYSIIATVIGGIIVYLIQTKLSTLKKEKETKLTKRKTIYFDLDATISFGEKDHNSIKREYFSNLGIDDEFIYSFHRLVTSYEKFNNNHRYVNCKQLSSKEIPFDDLFIDVKDLSNEYFEQQLQNQKYLVYKGEAKIINPPNSNPWIEIVAEKISEQKNICFYISRNDLIKDSKLTPLKNLINKQTKETFYVYILGQIKKSNNTDNYYIQPYNKNLRFISIPNYKS
ncbi:hypothetical protein LO80_01575 [Candidatus Francisella endociliophora]|uniref:Uncharacterized protein n=1 Tax=Candidatus Francisella endociliophora TaxID=653937 RepID=A0A097EMJ5_9GAMM|nr:hypothetical protein [Francisella sp. FSC1006]AIT08792.1 hypothetical protein LO80_01575 [Francisella sp. FSC1006]